MWLRILITSKKFSMRAHHILSASASSESVLWRSGIEGDAHWGHRCCQAVQHWIRRVHDHCYYSQSACRLFSTTKLVIMQAVQHYETRMPFSTTKQRFAWRQDQWWLTGCSALRSEVADCSALLDLAETLADRAALPELLEAAEDTKRFMALWRKLLS